MGLGRILVIVLGTLLALSGGLVALGAAALLVASGGGGLLESAEHRVAGSATALVTAPGQIDATIDDEIIGSDGPELRIRFRSAGARPVFVGIARRQDVDRYLAGADVEVVRDVSLDPFVLDRERRPGAATPPPPGEQPFWAARAESRGRAEGTLRWTVAPGTWVVVAMNADAARGVVFDATFGARVPNLRTWLVVGLAVGLGMLAAGVVLIVVAARRRRRREAGPPAWPSADAHVGSGPYVAPPAPPTPRRP